jgi:hypothetical protein
LKPWAEFCNPYGAGPRSILIEEPRIMPPSLISFQKIESEKTQYATTILGSLFSAPQGLQNSAQVCVGLRKNLLAGGLFC